ncbi:YwaF family protein [Candidatus Xianfuyuplasma coldseepsis]|uniref:YwaF family protein n=1 Tax=Candidatus Xianfuyuplasma coldseepsis TaxID=2782163 RepID=A0A7L7KSV9_9MOLU|nr:YwaF family protein [Xianfuyuplasma coldseepsis]QMS85316.1 YwaF family protein [Xianfuyuplasma coldseepsis]
MDFFSNEIGQTIPWFGFTHIMILLVFIASLVVLWILGPKIGSSSKEKWFRYGLIFLVVLFEWRVFEGRMLNGSLFRLPLCAISLYGLTFAIAFSNEKAYKIFYFYAFGTLLTFLFFDTLWGLDRWSGWTYFGAHATIGWLAVYGYRVLGYTPNAKDLHLSMVILAIYSFISGYAYYRYGGSDELFLFHAPADFMNFLVDINQVVYLLVFVPLAALLMHAMYLPIVLQEKPNKKA